MFLFQMNSVLLISIIFYAYLANIVFHVTWVCCDSCYFHFYLRQGGNVFARLCLFVGLWVSKITQKVVDGSFRNFESVSGMAKTTSDSILGVIRKESWFLDHFEIFVTIAFNGA